MSTESSVRVFPYLWLFCSIPHVRIGPKLQKGRQNGMCPITMEVLQLPPIKERVKKSKQKHFFIHILFRCSRHIFLPELVFKWLKWADRLVKIFVPPKMHGRFRTVIPKMNGRFCIGLPKVHGLFHMDPHKWYIHFRRFPTQSAPTRFPQSGNLGVP